MSSSDGPQFELSTLRRALDSMGDLEEETRLHPEDVNIRYRCDGPRRGDERAIIALLSHDADVNTLDVHHPGVVGHAADRS